jgi:hypothetical protein
MQVAIANQSAWQKSGLTKDLKAVTDTQYETAALRKLLD